MFMFKKRNKNILYLYNLLKKEAGSSISTDKKKMFLFVLKE